MYNKSKLRTIVNNTNHKALFVFQENQQTYTLYIFSYTK